ncbi:permease [Latilactobacillus sakei]
MDYNKRLLSYRIFDELGDWFYYFVIVLIVFKSSNNNPFYLGLLSASYTLPGVIGSSTIATILKKFNIRLSIIFMACMRSLLLVLMFISIRNTLLVIIFVFCEQLLSLGSKLAFQDMIVDIEQDEEILKKFNSSVSVWSTISRMCVIPIYYALTRIFSDSAFLLLDALFTFFAVISIVLIPNSLNFKQVKKHTIEKNSISNRVKLDSFSKLIIVALGVVGLVTAFGDAYGISAISDINGNTHLQYGLFIFMITVAELLAGISMKCIDSKITYQNRIPILGVSLLALSIMMIGISMWQTITILFATLIFSKMIFIWIQLYALNHFQQSFTNDIMPVLAIQNVSLDGVALFNSMVGAVLIAQFGIMKYIVVIGLNCLVLGSVIVITRKRW